MRFVPFIVAALTAIVACRGSSSSNNPDSPMGDTGGGGTVTIYQVQDDMMQPGTAVQLSGVVVTAIDTFGGKTGNIWVEDPMGGPRSGVLIYKADPNVVATLQPGDIVDVSNAVKSEFALMGSNADPTGRTDTELEPPASGQTVTLTKTGTGSVPAPAVVDALMIGQLADADMQGPVFTAAWEQWEGVLVTVQNVSALGAPKAFGSTMPPPADNYSFGMTGVAKIEGSLADVNSSGIARGTCFASVTGVVDYFYDYLLLPTSTTNIMTGGTGCPAAEATCADSIDNDGNGFADCGDDNCILTQGTCRMSVTINTLDTMADTNPSMPAFPVGGVELGAVYVTAINSAKTAFWVATSPTAAADGGLYIYGNGNALPTGLSVGSKLTSVIGQQVKAYNNDMMGESLPEFYFLSGTLGTGTTPPVPKAGLTAAQLATAATGRPYVGSVVTIATGGPIKLTTAETMQNFYTGKLTQGATMFNVLGDIQHDTDAVNTCYATVTGVWTYDVYNNIYALELQSTTPGTGCP